MTFRIHLVKPYEPVTGHVCQPPLGLLYLASSMRERLGDRVEHELIDAKLKRESPAEVFEQVKDADLIALSALNYEAPACRELARLVKAHNPNIIVAVGGPWALHRCKEIIEECEHFDWLFNGEGEHAFADTVERHLDGKSLDGVLGLFRRCEETGETLIPTASDSIMDLDALPGPAWDLVDFPHYKREPNMNSWVKGNLYAPLFTSRGCPYTCNYCHDLFGKGFRWRTAEHVVEEISFLYETYGVDEFQIVDDIFNLHKPRLKKIFALLGERYGHGKFNFCFPNGLRGDILDASVVAALKQGGTYQITVAVETVTERLQGYIDKHLKIDKVKNFINYCHNEGIVVKGFFMLGFPTESPREIFNTIRFAIGSKLTFAGFYVVVPQKETPLYELAREEGPEALELLEDGGYYQSKPWYELTHGYPLRLVVALSYTAFFFYPPRVWRLLKTVGPRHTAMGVLFFLDLFTNRLGIQKALQSLRGRLSGDEEAISVERG